ncbi:MAG: sulfotransferase [Acidobacteriota bacterium]|nr:sulfotransferase [Acidobacteriota bacterium]
MSSRETPPDPVPGALHRPSYRLVYIIGSGHCGSTLLTLLLNGHRDVLGLSEIGTIGDHVRQQEPERTLDASPWKLVCADYERSTGTAFSSIDLSFPAARTLLRWSPQEVNEWVGPNRALFDAWARTSKTGLLVDASKSWQRLYLLHRSGCFDLSVIHLVRDGRAVLNSYLRKYELPGFAFTKWPKVTLAALLLKRRIDPSRWLDVRYEDLARSPQRELSRICGFLDIAFTPEMLRYRSHEFYGLGGNRMLAGSGEAIRLDERWKEELPRRYRFLFSLFFGWLNRLAGSRNGR